MKLFWPSKSVRYGIFEKAQKLSFQWLCGWTLWRNQEFLTFRTEGFTDFGAWRFFLGQTNFNFELHHGSSQSRSPNVKVPLEFQPKRQFFAAALTYCFYWPNFKQNPLLVAGRHLLYYPSRSTRQNQYLI